MFGIGTLLGGLAGKLGGFLGKGMSFVKGLFGGSGNVIKQGLGLARKLGGELFNNVGGAAVN